MKSGVVIALVVVAMGCGRIGDTSGAAPPGSDVSPVVPTTAALSAADLDLPLPDLDLSGVVPASVPMAISEQLGSVWVAVRAIAGEEVVAGSRIYDSDTTDARLEIFGKDVAAIQAAIGAADGGVGDRVAVTAVSYSLAEMADLEARLRERGIAAFVMFPGVDSAITVSAETPDGGRDPAIESAVLEVAGDLPVFVEFTPPMAPLTGWNASRSAGVDVSRE